MNNTSLALTGTAARAIMPLSEAQSLGDVFFRSGRFKDQKNAAQAVVQILAGAEMGIGPMASMMGIYMVDGKPTFSANIVGAMIKRHPNYNYKVRELTDTVCRLEFFEAGESAGESTFTMDDAKNAGVANKGPWKAYPRNMLFARAMTNGARFYCPDVFSGIAVYTAEELGAEVEVDKNTGETRPVENATPPALNSAPANDADAPPTLTELVSLHAELGTPEGSLGRYVAARGIAPDLAERKPQKMTKDEVQAARDQLRAELADMREREALRHEANDGGPEDFAPEVIQDAMFTEDDRPEPEPEPAQEPVGINEAQRKRIMAMFNERKSSLIRKLPFSKNHDERRHAFACAVLNDETKGSSKAWTATDYKRVSDALELLAPDAGEDNAHESHD